MTFVLCANRDDIDGWGAAYQSATKMTIAAARDEYVNCENNGRTDSGKTHKEHESDHFDKNGNHWSESHSSHKSSVRRLSGL